MVQVAKFLGTRHFSFEFTVQQGLDVLNDVIYHLETFDVTTVSPGPIELSTRLREILQCQGQEKAPTRAFSLLKAPYSASTTKNLLGN